MEILHRALLHYPALLYYRLIQKHHLCILNLTLLLLDNKLKVNALYGKALQNVSKGYLKQCVKSFIFIQIKTYFKVCV